MPEPALGRRGVPRASMSIGEVLERLRPEFPEVSISKIRFLEEQGLVEPDRAPFGLPPVLAGGSRPAAVRAVRAARPLPAVARDPRAPRGDGSRPRTGRAARSAGADRSVTSPPGRAPRRGPADPRRPGRRSRWRRAPDRRAGVVRPDRAVTRRRLGRRGATPSTARRWAWCGPPASWPRSGSSRVTCAPSAPPRTGRRTSSSRWWPRCASIAGRPGRPGRGGVTRDRVGGVAAARCASEERDSAQRQLIRRSRVIFGAVGNR